MQCQCPGEGGTTQPHLSLKLHDSVHNVVMLMGPRCTHVWLQVHATHVLREKVGGGESPLHHVCSPTQAPGPSPSPNPIHVLLIELNLGVMPKFEWISQRVIPIVITLLIIPIVITLLIIPTVIILLIIPIVITLLIIPIVITLPITPIAAVLCGRCAPFTTSWGGRPTHCTC